MVEWLAKGAQNNRRRAVFWLSTRCQHRQLA
jgi:hypothetical protein